MTRILIGLLAAAATMAPAHAERSWLLPSATTLSGVGNWVTFDAANGGELFYPDHRPLQLDNVKIWQPDGSEGKMDSGTVGHRRSTFDILLDKPGTWKVDIQSTMVMGSFKLNGEERRVGRRPGGAGGPGGPGGPGAPGAAGNPPPAPPVSVADIPAEATDVNLTEVVNRNEVYVTLDAPTTTIFKTTGKGIELQPITHPDELIKGEPAKFRFLVDGKPAAGLKLTVVPGGKRYRDEDGGRDFTTGADGVVTLDWPEAGMYWLNATLTDNKPSEPKAQQRRLNYITTLEVLQP